MFRRLLKFSGGSASEETLPQQEQQQGDKQRDINLEMPLAPPRVAKPRSDLRGHSLLLEEGALSSSRDLLLSRAEPELLIARTQGSDELRHRLVSLQSTEAFDGFHGLRDRLCAGVATAARDGHSALGVPSRRSNRCDELIQTRNQSDCGQYVPRKRYVVDGQQSRPAP
jgi:hypothetical protein